MFHHNSLNNVIHFTFVFTCSNPTPEKTSLLPVSWKPFTETERRYFGIASKLLRKKNHRQSRVAFWRSLGLNDYQLSTPNQKDSDIGVVVDSLVNIYTFLLKTFSHY